MNCLAFGEVLWDIFDDRKEIGGAPFNFSAFLSRLGLNAYIATAVGNDALGKEALNIMDRFGVKRDYVKVADFPTGTCTVSCNIYGQPQYNLAQPVAWDHIDICNNLLNDVSQGRFELLYLGTLALRNSSNFSALETLLNNGQFKYVFCDLNLRQNFYNRERVEFDLKRCSILKINREELFYLAKENYIDSINVSQSDFYKSACTQISQKYQIQLVLLTLDKDGALVYDALNNEVYKSQKPKNKAVSCVGAGDSFSAAFIANFLYGYPVLECTERAVMLSDYVVTQCGAVPDCPQELINLIKPK